MNASRCSALRRLTAPALGLCLLAALSLSAHADTDFNTDGLDDVWQQHYNAWSLDPQADSDGDGVTNREESTAGTDPWDPQDWLHVAGVSRAPGGISLSVATKKGKRYQLQSSDSPNGPEWTDEDVPVTGTGVALDFLTSMNGGVVRKFFRVEARDVDTDEDGVSDWAEELTGTDATLASSPGNASGGTATDADVLESLMTVSATVQAGNGTALEKEDAKARITITRDPQKSSMRLTVPYTTLPNANAAKGTAGQGDYTLAVSDPNGIVTGSTTGAVTLPAGVSSMDVIVDPVVDASAEVPEMLTMKLVKPAEGPSSPAVTASVAIKDADPQETDNRTLFVAYLGREAGVTSTASGIATALVEGDNDGALISLTFSNLSSEQNTAYIRIDSDLDVLNVGLGQVSGKSWPIRAAHTRITDQAMLDALHNGDVFISITTADNPEGELRGYFNRANGSTEFNPDNPDLGAPGLGSNGWQTPTGEALSRDIYRFLSQCTFGATTALHDEVLAEVNAAGGNILQGYGNWLDKQMNPAVTPMVDFSTLVMASDNEEFVMRGNRPLHYASDPQYFTNAYSVSFNGTTGMPTISTTADTNRINNNYPNSAVNRRSEWWTMVLQSRDQVRQRMALALSEIVVISDNDQTVNDQHYACAEYWDMLAGGAFGKYRNLLQQVTYSPMMGIYLSHIGNRMAYDAGGGLFVTPDENYAREIMQLFSIGLVLRHPDGSLVLDAAGLPISTYDQTDITELARVMTGWSHGARHAVATVPTWNGVNFTNSQVRASPVIEYNGGVATWFGQASGTHRFFPAPWANPMKLIGRIGSTVYHDFGAKTLLGGKTGQTVVPAQVISGMTDAQTHTAAEVDVAIAHNMLAGNPSSDNGYDGHPNTPVNLSRWLIQRFTTSNPSAGYIYRVSEVYRNTNGNLGQVLKAILLDYEARSLEFADSVVSAGKLKEPMIHFASVLRSLRAYTGGPLSNLRDNAPPFGATDSPFSQAYPASEFNKFDMTNANPPSLPAGYSQGPFRFRFQDTTANLGQAPQRAPSVFNWFLPDYVVPGAMAQAGLFAPEMQITTESNEVARINWHWAFTWANIVGQSNPGTAGTGSGSARDFILHNNWATAAARFSTNTVTFNSSNWNTPQTVTITANNNGLLQGLTSGNIQFTLSGSTTTYNGVTVAPLPMSLQDDETPNESVIVTASGGNTWVQEGGKTDTFTVRLSAPPQAGSPVTVNMTAGSQVTLSTSSLVFDSATWATPQTVTITAVNDATSETQGTANASITFTTVCASANFNALTVPALAVSVLDNDDGANSFGVLITETGGGTSVDEASGSDTYTVQLTRAPTAEPVTVRATASPGLYMNPSGTTTQQDITFTLADWNTPKTFTVRANNDTTAESDHTVNISHSITANVGGYTTGLVIQPLTVTVTDNDNRLMLAHTDGDTRVLEGGFTDTISVRLRTQPTGTVSVSLGGLQVNCNPATLTFTNANWATPQNVTVSAVEDTVNEGLHTTNVTAYSSSTDGNYNNYGNGTSGVNFSAVSLPVSILDNDRQRVVLTESGGSTLVGEDGTTDTYTLVLNEAPTADVAVTLLPNAQVTVTPAGPVVFTPANWNTPVTITVGAVADTTVEPATTYLVAHSVSSADSRYNGISVPVVSPIVDDNELPLTVTHSNGFTTVAEGGGAGTTGTPLAQDTFTVVLTRAPSSGNTVTVTLLPDSQITVSPSTLTFTPSGAGIWSTAQTVTVTAVDDAVNEATPHAGMIAFRISSNDAYYNVNSAPPVQVAVKDNDAPGVSIVESSGTTLTTEGSGTDTYTVVLTKLPVSDVVVRVGCDAQSEVLMTGSTYAATKDLTFTPANWSTAQTVTVRAVNDTAAELRHLSTVTHSIVAASSSDEYDGVTGISSVVNIITDNDNTVAGNRVQISESSSSTLVSESGTSDTYTVVLSQAPTADVVVTATANSQLSISPPSLTFTPSNFNVAQTVTVRAVDDAVIESTPLYNGLAVGSPHFGEVTHSAVSTDAAFHNIAICKVTASVTDNDGPHVIITPTGGSTDVVEGGAQDTYTVVLSHAPTANVSIAMDPGAQATVAPVGPLTFTTGNWNVPQVVTVTAVNDTAVENNHTASIAHTITSTDLRYHGTSAATVSASVRDNDGPQVVVSHTSGSTSVTENGATDTISIVLTQAPAAGTTLSVNLVPPAYIIPTPPYAKQMGYFVNDLGTSNQRHRIILDYTEVILLYRTTFYASLNAAYPGGIPASPGAQQVKSAHWAATKAIVDRMDLWWAGGHLKALYPESVLVDRSQPPPATLPAPNPRQAILDAIYFLNGGTINDTLNTAGVTRYLAAVAFDPKAPPTGTFHDEIRDRARYAAYLVSIAAPAIVSH